jgi:hypothetical protein
MQINQTIAAWLSTLYAPPAEGPCRDTAAGMLRQRFLAGEARQIEAFRAPTVERTCELIAEGRSPLSHTFDEVFAAALMLPLADLGAAEAGVLARAADPGADWEEAARALAPVLRDKVVPNLPLWLSDGAKPPSAAARPTPDRAAVWSRVLVYGGFAFSGRHAVRGEEREGVWLARLSRTDYDRLLGLIARWDKAAARRLPARVRQDLLACLAISAAAGMRRGADAVRAALAWSSRATIAGALEVLRLNPLRGLAPNPAEAAAELVAAAWAAAETALALPAWTGEAGEGRLIGLLRADLFDYLLRLGGTESSVVMRDAARVLSGHPLAATSTLWRSTPDWLEGMAEGADSRHPHADMYRAVLPALLRAPVWERDLLRRLSALPPQQVPRDPPGDDEDMSTRPETWLRVDGREEAAKILLEAGANIGLWGSLLEPWLEVAETVMMREDKERSHWLSKLRAARDEGDRLAPLVERLLDSGEQATPEEYRRLAARFEEPWVFETILPACDPRKDRRAAARLVAGVVAHAEAASPTMLILASLTRKGVWPLHVSRDTDAIYRGLRRLHKADPVAYERTVEAAVAMAPKGARDHLRAVAMPPVTLAYRLDGDRLVRMDRSDWAALSMGHGGFEPGEFTAVVLSGVGGRRRLDHVDDAFASDVTISEDGFSTTVIGEEWGRSIAGRVRPLEDAEIAAIHRLYPDAPEEVLQHRRADVSDIVAAAREGGSGIPSRH